MNTYPTVVLHVVFSGCTVFVYLYVYVRNVLSPVLLFCSSASSSDQIVAGQMHRGSLTAPSGFVAR